MSDLINNAISFLQKKFPGALTANHEWVLIDSITGKTSSKIWPIIIACRFSGIKQRALALPDCGISTNEIFAITKQITAIFNDLDSRIKAGFDYALPRSGHPINTTQMNFSSRIIIYTNKIHNDIQSIINAFSLENILIEIINESELFYTTFISYGDPDKETASKINTYLKQKGIKTFFFLESALPGQKLHRMMSNEVRNYERTLLICSKNSLQRNGVLNEIEQALERESAEGGSEILIPITLDNYVFNWEPKDKPDRARAVRLRTITKIDSDNFDSPKNQMELDKIIQALRKKF